MKKNENLKSNLFKKFEENKIENLNTIFGGFIDPGTVQDTDCSLPESDCTSCPTGDVSGWNKDSSATGDTIRSTDGCNEPTYSFSAF
jgi:hypothetical protein